MKVRYYPETDSLYVELSEEPSATSEEVAPQTVLDFDAAGRVVGIEVYGGAAATVDLSTLRLERKEEAGADAVLTLDTRFLLEAIRLTAPKKDG